MSKQISCNDCYKQILKFDTKRRRVWGGIRASGGCWWNIHNYIMVCKDCYRKNSGIFGDRCQLCQRVYLDNDDDNVCHHPSLELCNECSVNPYHNLCDTCTITQKNLFERDYICDCGGRFSICDGEYSTWNKVEYKCGSCHKKDSKKRMVKTRLEMRKLRNEKNKMRNKVLIQKITCKFSCGLYNLCSDCIDIETELCRLCYQKNAWNKVLLQNKALLMKKEEK